MSLSDEKRDLIQRAVESQVRVNADPEGWETVYGFPHTCTCGDDLLNDNMVEVTRCFHQLTEDAMSTCVVQQKALRDIAEGKAKSPELYAQEFTR